MDLKLRRLSGRLGARPVFSLAPSGPPPVAIPGELRLICSACPAVVAKSPALGTLTTLVFRCLRCGTHSQVEPGVPDEVWRAFRNRNM
jgi:hypothetical protein